MSFLVRLKEDDIPFKLKKGDVLRVKTSGWDPYSKYHVICRVSDGYDPKCNVYKSQVEKV